MQTTSSKRVTRRAGAKMFTVSFPQDLVEEIDIICQKQYISRTSWILAAAKEKMEKDRILMITKLKNSNII